MPRSLKIPTRDDLPEDERESYDAILAGANIPLEVTRDGEKIFDWDHSALFLDYFSRLLISPEATRALRMLGGAVRKFEYTPGSGSYSPADHELADLVLCFDAEYWALLRIHTPSAVVAGIAVETIEALRDGREDELDDDTRFVAQFVREVAAGTLTDATWDRMERRIGSERGAVDYVLLILLLQMHLRLHHVFKIEAIPEDEYSAMLDELRAGGVNRSTEEAQAFVNRARQ